MYNISSLEIKQNTIGYTFILVFNYQFGNWNNLKITKPGKITIFQKNFAYCMILKKYLLRNL